MLKNSVSSVSEGNEERIIGNGKEGTPHYKAAKNLAELCSPVSL